MSDRKPVTPNHATQIKGRQSTNNHPNRDAGRNEHNSQHQRWACNGAYGAYLVGILELDENYELEIIRLATVTYLGPSMNYYFQDAMNMHHCATFLPPL